MESIMKKGGYSFGVGVCDLCLCNHTGHHHSTGGYFDRSVGKRKVLNIQVGRKWISICKEHLQGLSESLGGNEY